MWGDLSNESKVTFFSTGMYSSFEGSDPVDEGFTFLHGVFPYILNENKKSVYKISVRKTMKHSIRTVGAQAKGMIKR